MKSLILYFWFMDFNLFNQQEFANKLNGSLHVIRRLNWKMDTGRVKKVFGRSCHDDILVG